jgi:hypothetical protein
VIHVRQPGSLLIKYLVLSGALLFSIMARSSSGSSSTLAGVCVPVYDLAPGRILRAVEHASSLTNEYADDAGEFYSMAMAELLVAAEVPTGAIIPGVKFADVPPGVRHVSASDYLLSRRRLLHWHD